MEKQQWFWIWRFLIFWGWNDEPLSISFYKKNMEDEIWSIPLTWGNIIKISHAATIVLIVIVAIAEELWR